MPLELTKTEYELLLFFISNRGRAIVKSICDYHEWTISYTHKDAHHQFRVVFPQKALNRSSHSPLP